MQISSNADSNHGISAMLQHGVTIYLHTSSIDSFSGFWAGENLKGEVDENLVLVLFSLL
ncbi:MAG: hypothetical protein ACLFT4_05880 [Bacteroidales bacterium]